MAKNCLIFLKNKKINDSEEAGEIISAFASGGFFFDKTSFVAYNVSDEILRAVNDGLENYENLVVRCPQVMRNTLEQYISSKTGGEFDDRGFLKTQNVYVFLCFTDFDGGLSVADVVAILDKRYGVGFAKTYLKTVGAQREEINKAVAEAKKLGDVEISVYEKFGECKIEIVYSETTPKMTLDAIIRSLLSSLNDYVYAMEDVSLAERLIQLLGLRRMKISVAESFTGGGICKRIVEVPGASEVFFEGLNTYSNESKCERLGVNDFTLMQHGAVSEETAREMAQGLLNTGKCDVCVATTGIAGPKSDNTQKPVGLAYIAVGTDEGVTVTSFNFVGSRRQITETAINYALFLVYKTVK